MRIFASSSFYNFMASCRISPNSNLISRFSEIQSPHIHIHTHTLFWIQTYSTYPPLFNYSTRETWSRFRAYLVFLDPRTWKRKFIRNVCVKCKFLATAHNTHTTYNFRPFPSIERLAQTGLVYRDPRIRSNGNVPCSGLC